MSTSNKVKAEALGMAHGTASARLKRMILFSLICKLEENFCFRCGKEIFTPGDLSIEHKEPWLHADNPVATFFDLDNIAFSHLSCNSGAASQVRQKYFTREERRVARRKTWHSLGKKEQQKRRREQYHRHGC